MQWIVDSTRISSLSSTQLLELMSGNVAKGLRIMVKLGCNMEHVQEMQSAMQELRKALIPGGADAGAGVDVQAVISEVEAKLAQGHGCEQPAATEKAVMLLFCDCVL
jgi:hypothetical protein